MVVKKRGDNFFCRKLGPTLVCVRRRQHKDITDNIVYLSNDTNCYNDEAKSKFLFSLNWI